MKTVLIILALLVAGSAGSRAKVMIGGPSYMQQAMNEEQKINQLLAYIEKTDAIFIRNGSEYSGKDAAKHLKMKRDKAGNKVKTARDFIDYIASKSSMSGDAYMIRFKNGTVLPVRDVLYYELKKIESGKVGLYSQPKSVKSQAC